EQLDDEHEKHRAHEQRFLESALAQPHAERNQDERQDDLLPERRLGAESALEAPPGMSKSEHEPAEAGRFPTILHATPESDPARPDIGARRPASRAAGRSSSLVTQIQLLGRADIV